MLRPLMEGLRAPSTDRTVLAVPGFDRFRSFFDSNQSLFQKSKGFSFSGELTFGDLRDLSRQELSRHLFPERAGRATSLPLILTGHQPELSHPGVWAKYFWAAGMAKATGGVAFNLVADADSCHQTVIGFPGKSPFGRIRRDWLRVGLSQSEGPWQLAQGPDPGQQKSFFDRLANFKDRLGWVPVGAEGSIQPEIDFDSKKLGDWTGLLRRKAQESLGLNLPDISQSAICQGEAFGWFSGDIFQRAGVFRELHNKALLDFRLKAGIKNPGQPVPPLDSRGDWIEAPFWIWRNEPFDGRKRVWVRGQSPCEFSVGTPENGEIVTLRGISFREIPRYLASKCLSLRPRALTNTLFLRWFCCDWFVHGLGGAIYDQITDRLGEDFYRHVAPAYGMVTATLRLPFSDCPPVNEAEIGERIRQFWWNPGIGAISDFQTRELVNRYEESRGVAPKKTTRQLLWDLRRQLENQYHRLDLDLWESKKKNQSRALALSREWPWIFHPQNRLAELLMPLMEPKV